MPEVFYIYILASGYYGTLYIGYTNNLEQRYKTHRNKLVPGSFTAKYNVNQLVYFESFATQTAAQAREKQLKKFSRQAKIQLVEKENPRWLNLAASW